MLANATPFLVFFLGALMLYYGSEYLISHSSHLAKKFNLPNIFIGVTIIAIGTSLPEFVVSLEAGYKQQFDLIIGNIIGSNISNICLVFGIVLLFYNYRINDYNSFSRSISFLFIISFMFFYFINNTSTFDLRHSIALILFLTSYVYVLIKFFPRKKDDSKQIEKKNYLDFIKPITFIVIGIFLLSFGADAFIYGASQIAILLGVQNSIIGLTLVALGTSIPELFVSINAATKKEFDFVIGNVIGSNIINISFVGGISSLISNFTFVNSEFYVSNIVLLLITLFLVLLFFQKKTVNKLLGLVFIIIYLIFLYINFIEGF